MRKPKKPEKRKPAIVEKANKRTTISLSSVVWDMAEECMGAKGFNYNFSAYVADLIRRDQERMEEEQK